MSTRNRQNDRNMEPQGPFPEPQAHEHPWEASETERGPFERRRSPDRRLLAEEPDRGCTSEVEDVEPSVGGRRRWGRRKTDVLRTDAREALPSGTRRFVRRFREPIIGLTLAGVAAPLINATIAPPEQGRTNPPKRGAEEATEDPVVMDRDLEGEVGDFWAEAEAEVVRGQTVEGAVTRYEIDSELAEKIYDYAEKHEIEPDVAYGLVFTESTFRDRAVSHVGARGLTQLMPRTAKWLDPSVSTRDLFDRDVNLDLGFRYLRQLIDKYDGDVENALTAYNRGPGTVDRILKRGGNPDNGYAGKVLAG
jgi:hypothetical protein